MGKIDYSDLEKNSGAFEGALAELKKMTDEVKKAIAIEKGKIENGENFDKKVKEFHDKHPGSNEEKKGHNE